MLRKGESGTVNPNSNSNNAFQIQSKSVSAPIDLLSLVFSHLKQSWTHQNTNLCHGLEGLILSNSSLDSVNDINITAGSAVLPIGVRSVGSLSTTLTKRLDAAWALGHNQGGRFSGVSLSNTTYHVFLIKNTSTSAVDVGFDTSVIAANRPSGWSARRVGSIIRASNAIVRFTQFGDYFSLKTVAVDLAGVEVPLTATNYTLTIPAGIPVLVNGVLVPGLATYADNWLSLSVQSPNQTTQVPVDASVLGSFRGSLGSSLVVNGVSGAVVVMAPTSVMQVMSNTSRQLKFTRSNSYFSPGYFTTWLTLGWTDVNLQGGS